MLDGGGKVTLSGGGQRRILYMNTCDQAQVWTTSHCQDQDHPRLTVQNLTFVDGNATGDTTEGGGGGAIFVRGGRLKVVTRGSSATAATPTGPDVGGAAVRVLSQSQGLPVYVVGSTFGGAAGQGGRCSNGGALEQHRRVVGGHQQRVHPQRGHRPRRQPGRGGHAGWRQRRRRIYNDGNRFTVRVAGSVIEDNHANEGGGAIFFVSNDRTGTLRSTARRCAATRATGSRPRASPASSSSARASPPCRPRPWSDPRTASGYY